MRERMWREVTEEKGTEKYYGRERKLPATNRDTRAGFLVSAASEPRAAS